MKHIYLAAVLLLVAVFFFECQKDLNYIGSADAGITAITPNPIKSTLQGNIIDENNLPAAGVTITVGTMTAITNGSGYFRISGASLDKNTSLVTAEKEGYFKGYRVFAATSGTNQIVIKLVTKNSAGTIAASSGGAATLSNGSKISLPANSVILASSGIAYAGDIKVYASYIDPKAGDITETVPGSFVANDKNGKRVILSSYGMLAVQLESPGGQKLQIKSGFVATITCPIPLSGLSSAPSTIALWYVDELTGVWKEEGAATKQGNNYVGDVKHFSFWNCDRPFDAISLSMTLNNANKLPLIYVPVKITNTDSSTNGSSSAYGFTDSTGQVTGMVPAGKNLVIEVLDPCGNAVYSKNVSPLAQNTDLGIVTVANATTSLLTITGTLVDCNRVPVKNGVAVINYDNIMHYAATDVTGHFTTAFVVCSGTSSTMEVLGVDKTSLQQGTNTIVQVTAPVTNTGNITACGTILDQYVNYTIDGTDYSITSAATDSITGYANNSGTTTQVFISAGSQIPLGLDNMRFTVDNASAAGTFPLSALALRTQNNVTLTKPFDVTFTNYANAVGEYYEGSFSGKFGDSILATIHHTITTTFKVKRAY